MATIPASHRDILTGPNYAHLATLMKDGSPQVTPVWVDVDGDTVIINTAEGRTKTRNLDRDGRVAISVHDQANPYRYIQIRGKVVEKTSAGADEHINRLAKKYLGQDTYPFSQPGEVRVLYKIEPASAQTNG